MVKMLNFKIYDSLEITKKKFVLLVQKYNLTLENTVHAISMDSTDGLSRGYEVVGTVNADWHQTYTLFIQRNW
jgi:F0F1-type ATP synthase beta subunit